MLQAERVTAVDRVRTDWLRPVAYVALIAVLVSYPAFAGAYYTYLGGLTLIAVIGAVGMNLLTGYAGLVSFGAAAFLAIGGFSAAWITVTLGFSYWLSLPLAVVLSGLVGVAVGIPSLRLRGLYMVLTTLGLHYIVLYVCDRYQRQTGHLGGFNIVAPHIGSLRLGTTVTQYYLPLTFAALTVVYCANLLRGRVGRALIAVRDRDAAAAILGVDVARYKLAAFVVSSALLGLAGAIQVLSVGNVTVENYDLLVAVNYIAMFIIGGTASLRGSVVGAAFVTLLPVAVQNLLGRLPASNSFVARLNAHVFDVNALLFGALIILFVRLEPGGLISLWDRLVDAVRLSLRERTRRAPEQVRS